LWLGVLELWAPVAISGAAVVAAFGLAAGVAALGSRKALGTGSDNLSPMIAYLACGCLAYAIVYTLSPGYVLTGYLQRWAPLTVFVVDAAMGVAFYIMLRASVSLLRSVVPRSASQWTHRSIFASVLGGVLLSGLAVFSAADWVHLQLSYVALLPPTHFSFLKDLAKEPFRGASFVANTYAAPIAYFTGKWAYSDALISSGKVVRSDDGYVVDRDARTYLWLADKNENIAYLAPDYFACLYQQNPVTAWVQVSHRQDSFKLSCSTQGILQPTASSQSLLHDKVIAIDGSPAHAWSIVKLDWDYPPFLRPKGSSTASSSPPVSLDVQPTNGSLVVHVMYVYAQQGGKPESGSEIRWYGVKDNGERCLITEAINRAQFDLPSGFQGRLQVSVLPRTSTKAGAETFSLPVRHGSSNDACNGRADGPIMTALDLPLGTRQLSATDPALEILGKTIRLSPGDLVYKEDTTELLRFTDLGYVPVAGAEGDLVRVAYAGGQRVEGAGVRFRGGRWTPDAELLP
jgi:hypothetical protein